VARQSAVDAGLLRILEKWTATGAKAGATDLQSELAEQALGVILMLKPDEAYLRRVVVPLLARDQPIKFRAAALGALGDKQNAWAVDLLLDLLKQNLAENDPQVFSRVVSAAASALAEIDDPKAVPVMIGVIDADSTSATIYWMGHFGLTHFTGVRYEESHNGTWWREWWEKNKGRYPQAVRSLKIPKLTRGTKGGLGDTSGTAGLILLVGSMVASGPATAAAQERGQPKSKTAGRDDPTKAKAKEARSLLSNGGVEEGRDTATGWQTGADIDGVQYLWDKKIAHSGRASLCLKKTARRYFPIAQWFQEVAVPDGAARVKVGAWIKAQRMTKATLEVQFYDGALEMVDHKWAAYVGAREANDPPATHDWKWYDDVVDVPAGAEKLVVAAQIYGPGTVWFDDLVATVADGATEGQPAGERRARLGDAGNDALVPSVERTAGGDAQKRYFLVGPATKDKAPAEGYRLLVVLPGGDGSAEFNPFIRQIAKNSLSPGYLLAQPVAIEWQPGQAASVVWPTDAHKLPGQRFSTEDFVEAVIADVRRTHRIDPRYVFVLGWSSGGPPTYAVSLRDGSSVTGAFVAMSIFPKPRLPDLARAKGRSYYLLHSPQDFIPIRTVEGARDALRQSGAQVELQTYEGGHGWHGDRFDNIGAGVRWLEEHHGVPTGG
jgi:predicted esterase